MNDDPRSSDETKELVHLLLSLQSSEIHHESSPPPSSDPLFETAPPDVITILGSNPTLRQVGRRLLLCNHCSSYETVYTFLRDVDRFLRDQKRGLVPLAPKMQRSSDTAVGAATTRAETCSSPPTKNVKQRGPYKIKEKFANSSAQTSCHNKSAQGGYGVVVVEATSEPSYGPERTLIVQENFRADKSRGWTEISETTRNQVKKATKASGDIENTDDNMEQQEDES